MAKDDNVIRVAVGTPEAHSPTWRIWHSGPRDDLYVGCRRTASEMKVSLHASGDFRFAFTDKHVESDHAVVTKDKRVLGDRWRPVEAKPGLWRTLSLRAPWFALTLDDPLASNVTLAPTPPEGSEKVLAVVVARAGIEFVDRAAPDGRALGPVRMPSGATAWVVVREMPIPDATLAEIHQQRRVRVLRDGVPESGVHLMMIGMDEYGVGYLRDVPAAD